MPTCFFLCIILFGVFLSFVSMKLHQFYKLSLWIFASANFLSPFQSLQLCFIPWLCSIYFLSIFFLCFTLCELKLFLFYSGYFYWLFFKFTNNIFCSNWIFNFIEFWILGIIFYSTRISMWFFSYTNYMVKFSITSSTFFFLSKLIMVVLKSFLPFWITFKACFYGLFFSFGFSII